MAKKHYPDEEEYIVSRKGRKPGEIGKISRFLLIFLIILILLAVYMVVKYRNSEPLTNESTEFWAEIYDGDIDSSNISELEGFDGKCKEGTPAYLNIKNYIGGEEYMSEIEFDGEVYRYSSSVGNGIISGSFSNEEYSYCTYYSGTCDGDKIVLMSLSRSQELAELDMKSVYDEVIKDSAGASGNYGEDQFQVILLGYVE